MSAIVEGVYKEGKIELLEVPSGVTEGRVRVIVMFETSQREAPPRTLTYGMYPGDASTLEDFNDAQWHADTEWNDAGEQ